MSNSEETQSSQEQETTLATKESQETPTQTETTEQQTDGQEQQTEEQQTEEQKSGTESEDGQQLDLDLESLTFPEGFQKSDEMLSSFKGVLEDTEKSPQERAQALVDLHVNAMQAASERVSEQWQQTRSEWVEEVKADSEIGGDKLDPALGEISKVVDEYGGQDLRNLLDDSGLGDHPVVVKFLYKVAKQLNEPGPVSGGPTNTPPTQAKRIYPSME